MSERTRRVAVELAAFVCALVALALAMRTLEAARRKSEPRRALVQEIRREATPRDLIVINDEAPELLALASPVPALWGNPPLDDLRGIRRLYVLASSHAALGPFQARLGEGRRVGDARTMAWDIEEAHLGATVFNAAQHLGTQVQARREGGVDDGPCPVDGNLLTCHGAPWNHIQVGPHHFEGAEVACIFAHPQADGRLIFEVTGIPPARSVVGIVGVDDGGYFPEGADVTMHVEYRADGHAAVVRDIVGRNKRGLTAYRVEVPRAAATAQLTVTTPNAGARQFCFTFVATD
jgi:hypothetical protein